jgi:hypothetical protein
MRLFVEVQRRGILRVATGYLIVSWLVLEVGHTLFNVFELPHAGLQFVFVLLALGFPIALLGAWQGWFGTNLQRGTTRRGLPTPTPTAENRTRRSRGLNELTVRRTPACTW